MKLTPRQREIAGGLGAFVVAFLASVIITWPMVLHLDEVVLGGGELGGWLWRYDWHFRSLDAIMQLDMNPIALWREFVGLGRYPETGNILDVLAFSYPLQRLFGFPAGYNLKILLILSLNGVTAYALARYVSGSVAAALAASVVAVINPLTLLEVQACGLRQAILWWVLLYPALLDRALRRRTIQAGLLAGACFGMSGAFYWFYGLFTGIFTAVWLVKHVIVERGRFTWFGIVRSMLGVGLGTLGMALPFLLPYLSGGTAGGGQQAAPNGGGSLSEQLPEMTFFLPFPAYDTISHAPLRPSTYAENVLASLHRTIGSSWSATYPVDPQLNEALPLVVFLFGVMPAVFRRRSWGWLVVWIFFYLGTLGPYLRIGKGDNQNVLKVFDDFVVRLPYTWMFQWVPGMARMFAPYRLGAFVVVASVALLAIGLSRIRWRSWLAPLIGVAIVAQPLYRWGKGAVSEGDADSREWRSPIKINRIRVPDFYKTLDPAALSGIVELPLEQQQDLTCYYQIIHGQKVYRGWASPGSIPPALRKKGTGGDAGEQLRYQARSDVTNGAVPEAWMALSRDPDVADLSALSTDALKQWATKGNYRLAIVHERGYYLVDPKRGSVLYQAARDAMARQLGTSPEEFTELEKGDPANPQLGVPIVGDLVPWTSQPADLPPEIAPPRFRMSVFALPVLTEAETATEPATAEAGADQAPVGPPLGDEKSPEP